MCLVPVSKSPNLVVNDFYVQKVVLVVLSDFTVYTPTQNLPLGKLWKLKGKVVEPEEFQLDISSLNKIIQKKEEVGMGMIHSFLPVYTEEMQESISNGMCLMSGQRQFLPVFITAVIPQGAFYVLGENMDVASSKIRVTKIPYCKIIKEWLKYKFQIRKKK